MPSSFPPDENSFPTNNGRPHDPSGHSKRNGSLGNRQMSKDQTSKDTGALLPSDGELLPMRQDTVTPPEQLQIMEDQGERFDQARNSALKVYVVLVVAGVIIGLVSLFGIVLLMQHFGLTDVPVQVEQN